jgi:hypothetical protein
MITKMHYLDQKIYIPYGEFPHQISKLGLLLGDRQFPDEFLKI